MAKIIVENQYNQPEQVYNYVAKNGVNNEDILKTKEVPQYTIIKDAAYGSVVQEYINWNTETYTATLVAGNGGYYDSYGMTPPASVTATGTPWDNDRTSIRKIIIQNGVTISSDMDYWFANCTNLSSVEIGSGITRLGEG